MNFSMGKVGVVVKPFLMPLFDMATGKFNIDMSEAYAGLATTNFRLCSAIKCIHDLQCVIPTG